MKLRALKQEDAEYMLEWMHDSDVVENLQANFADKTIDDCKTFIFNCNDLENFHYAVTDDNDQYMGTVSLKHIHNNKAEFAIVITKQAMGKGYANWAMQKILWIGFNTHKLKFIYWCVSNDNKRAIHFYDKHNYCRISVPDSLDVTGYSKEQIKTYIWYQVTKQEFLGTIKGE